MSQADTNTGEKPIDLQNEQEKSTHAFESFLAARDADNQPDNATEALQDSDEAEEFEAEEVEPLYTIADVERTLPLFEEVAYRAQRELADGLTWEAYDAGHLLGSAAVVIEKRGNGKTLSLDLEETLIALSISATMNPAAQMAVEALERLRGCEVHITHIPTPGDAEALRQLMVNVTSDPDFASKALFVT